MKKSISIFLILAFFIAGYGQETNLTIPEITKVEYLKKSKNQKTAAWVLLGTGSLALILGSIEVNPDYGESTNRPFLVIGGLVMVGTSVPLFIASAKNRKRAMSLSFNKNRILQLRINNVAYSLVRSLSLRISI